MKPEILALGFNTVIFLIYLSQWAEPGKICYWGGVIVLTIGLYLMRG